MSRVDLGMIGKAGERRRRALAQAERELDLILLAIEQASPRPNLKAIAAAAQVPRSLLYRRLADRDGAGAEG